MNGGRCLPRRTLQQRRMQRRMKTPMLPTRTLRMTVKLPPTLVSGTSLRLLQSAVSAASAPKAKAKSDRPETPRDKGKPTPKEKANTAAKAKSAPPSLPQLDACQHAFNELKQVDAASLWKGALRDSDAQNRLQKLIDAVTALEQAMLAIPEESPLNSVKEKGAKPRA